ncbi:uncharacterized protein LY89DRAFT_715024 [Mollisia scopiformis]|uniref:Uncharacterized protein n=1 Tax=Mollisia scopiformis TaxID=149040 RepID=A0A194XP46_MOLSC|nr:uncharacterized protein LY89DRAFT_715024 [Mollisia scopiformis]KUJ22020.1 hypothetical protein LY89DRAFT_715024 [Mollisia scopiformis]
MVRPQETQSAPASPSSRSRFRFESATTSFDDLDLPPTSSTSTTEPIFCCPIHSQTLKQDGFHDFVQEQSGCPLFDGSVRSIGADWVHVIAVTPTSKHANPNTLKKQTRYFANLESVSEYQEIDSILYTYLLETSEWDETTTKDRFTCPVHRQTYQLGRQDRLIVDDKSSELLDILATPVLSPSAITTEGYGDSRPVLSPSRLSLEKRRFMIRKLSYGRKDQIQEIIKKATIQDKDQELRESWRLYRATEQEKKKAMEEKLDFEVRYCLAGMRMFFFDRRGN